MKNKISKILLSSIALTQVIMPCTMAASGLLGSVTPETSSATDSIITGGNQVAGIVAAIGVSAALAILIWLGIKYMTAAPGSKADVKKSAVPFIIGAVLLFAATGIFALISNFAIELNTVL